MPFQETNVMDERIKFVIEAMRQEVPFGQLCREFHISRPTGYRWVSRFQESSSVLSLFNRSRRPHHSPTRTGSHVEQRIVSLRQKYGWGAKKIRELLLEEQIDKPVSTINRVLKRNGMVTSHDRCYDAPGRFERSRPNELWQMDFKGEFVMTQGTCYPLTVLDDHSRYALGVFALPSIHGVGVQQSLRHCFVTYGVPEAMLMDHGTPWWSTTNAYGLTALSIWLIKQGVRIILSGIRHPQTQGKIERFHRTLKEDILHLGRPDSLPDWQQAFDRFRDCYNHVRPHESLDMGVPVQRYHASSRLFQPNPPPWHYPCGAVVKKLSSHGCLPYQGRYYFVCEALRGEWVRLETLPNSLLVSYRHMYIREIDLENKTTKPLLMPVLKQTQV